MANAAQLPNEPVLLHQTLEDGIVRVTLNRPKAANSLSHELVHELHAAFDTSAQVTILASRSSRPKIRPENAKPTLRRAR
jgi:hypothetical protein